MIQEEQIKEAEQLILKRDRIMEQSESILTSFEKVPKEDFFTDLKEEFKSTIRQQRNKMCTGIDIQLTKLATKAFNK